MREEVEFPDVALPKREGEDAVLREDIVVISSGFRICVPAGTRTDGASIPRSLWAVCGHPLMPPRVYAALVHDYIYGGGMPVMTRKDADRVYRDLLVRYGWGSFRASVEYYAIRWFGGGHWSGLGKNN